MCLETSVKGPTLETNQEKSQDKRGAWKKRNAVAWKRIPVQHIHRLHINHSDKRDYTPCLSFGRLQT